MELFTISQTRKVVVGNVMTAYKSTATNIL